MNKSLYAIGALASLYGFGSAETYQLENDWMVDFEQDGCVLKVMKQTEQGPVTVLDRSASLVVLGQGTVDDSKPIMKSGNIQRFPKAKKETANQVCDQLTTDGKSVSMSGSVELDFNRLWGEANADSLAYTMSFSVVDSNRVSFSVEVPGARDFSDYVGLTWDSDSTEEIYGLGLQYSIWNHKGQQVPLITTEAGVGRGLQPITAFLNLFAAGGGGNATTSYAPAAQFITNRQRGMIFDNLKIGIADFTKEDHNKVLFWHEDKITGTLLFGQDFMELSQVLNQTTGLMAPLPEWVMQGVVVGVVNGEDFVREQYAKLKEADVPMVGIWMQDWVGQHDFPEGTRLLWNWQLSYDQYPTWNDMVDEWAQDGVKPFIYINPYISDLSSFEGVNLRQDQYAIGSENGYFVKNQDGGVYNIDSISIKFAMVDFTNPDAYNWFKNIIKDNLIVEGRAGGWMHDFGEYLPFDAVLFDGSDPYEYHNQYPADWARCVHDAVSEVEGGEDIVYFMRSGTGVSAKDTRLFWMGDQLVTFDHWDGLHSALIGLMNGGLSGFTLGHSDIGGYTAQETIIIDYLRTKELLLRWIEMNTFSDPFMRSHPSNLPDDNYQIYDEEDSILFLKKFADIHVQLADYKMKLMEETGSKGTPFTRPLLLNFPDDTTARGIYDEFMLGDNILMAPIFKKGQTSRDVYLPGPATWTHMFTGESFEVGTDGMTLSSVECELGTPAVYTRDTDFYNMSALFHSEAYPFAQ